MRPPPHHIRFGPFELHPDDRLVRDGHVLAIAPKEALVLRALVAASGGVVSKAALLDLAWPGEDVSEASLTTCIHTLRSQLTTPGRTESCIGTVYGRGYRLTLPVVRVGAGRDVRLSALERATPRVREAYLEARMLFRARTPDRVTRGVALCEQAIAWDPDFAPAYVLLAECLNSAVFMSALPRAASLARITSLLAHAHHVDPDTPGLAVLEAATRSAFLWDFEGAEAMFRAALDRDPADVVALGFYNRHQYCAADPARQLDAVERLLELDPLNAWAQGAHGHSLLCAGRTAEALDAARRALATDASTSSLAYHALITSSLGHVDEALGSARALMATARHTPIAMMMAAEVFALAGEGGEARALLDQAEATPEWRSPTFAAAAAYALDDVAGAVGWLRRALALRDVWLPGARIEPRFAGLRALPAVRAVFEQISPIAIDVR